MKDYSLTNEVKRKLGKLINISRSIKQKEYNGLIENNPYTKESFSKDICHYHTLTKLENDIVREDLLYHIFLEKLEYKFQIESEDHELNFIVINELCNKLLYTNEYLDAEILQEIIDKIKQIDFSSDCISNLHLQLIHYTCKLQKLISTEEELTFVEKFINFYEGVYLGIGYHYLGVSDLRKRNLDMAEQHLLNSKNIYEKLNISKGIVNSNLIYIYEYKSEYLNAVNLCKEMEKYFIETSNNKRLIHIYNFLSYFYLMINDLSNGKKYYYKCIELIEKNDSLLKYLDTIQYNFGIYILKNFDIEESREYLLPSYHNCSLADYKLQTKNVLLMMMTSLKSNESEIMSLIYDGVMDSNIKFQTEFLKYFIYKYEKTGYHRKYALEKLIPYYKQQKDCDELLFLYEELYG